MSQGAGEGDGGGTSLGVQGEGSLATSRPAADKFSHCAFDHTLTTGNPLHFGSKSKDSNRSLKVRIE